MRNKVRQGTHSNRYHLAGANKSMTAGAYISNCSSATPEMEKATFKRTSGILHHFNQGVQCRDIRAFGYIIDTTFIGIIIVVIMIGTYIKETVTFQMNDLMYFKIKTDSSHFYYCFVIYHSFLTHPS